MKMQVLTNTRARSLPLIETDIDALAVKVLFQDNSTALEQVHYFVSLVAVEVFQSLTCPEGTKP